MRQETIEEAAERMFTTKPSVPIDSLNKLELIHYLNNAKKKEGFIEGAKSDAARDYWFEQFKK